MTSSQESTSLPNAPRRRVGKPEVRRYFADVRDRISAEDVATRSRRIHNHLLSHPVIRSANVIHSYWPRMEQNEVDTRSIIDALVSKGREVVLPVVQSFDLGSPEMVHRQFSGREALTLNRWGLLEPADGPEIDPARIDVVLAPALGAGFTGHRVGYGGGYYDAFLRGLDATTFVLTYDDCFLPNVPHDPHDVPASHVVTERGVFDATAPQCEPAHDPGP